MTRPSLDEVKAIGGNGGFSVVPVCKEILSDIKTPIAVLGALMKISDKYFLLESVEGGEKWSRYSFLGYNPLFTVTAKDGVVKINGKEKQWVDPIGELRDILKCYKAPAFDFMPTFTGGLVGYVAYDSIKYAEPKLKFNTIDETNFNDYELMLFDKVIAFDHFRQKIIVIVNVRTNNIEKNYKEAEQEIESIIDIIKMDSGFVSKPSEISEFTACGSKEKFIKMVKKSKEHIVDGDIFQVVLSRRFKARIKGDLLSAYRVLRTINPSPYMFYINTADVQIAGASPETLVKLEGKKISTFPLAGTRRRGKDDEEDERLIAELLSDEKELAEHNMLVDLGRNDVGRVAKFGSVHVTQYADVLKFSHVCHIASTVVGELKDGMDAIDALKSLLPAGTLSGAPKIRACEIIDELEASRRGVYGGAVGYIDFSGNMDMCIAIRMAVKKGEEVYVQSGAGIVADSVPESEYTECENKAKAMIRAIEMSKEEMD